MSILHVTLDTLTIVLGLDQDFLFCSNDLSQGCKVLDFACEHGLDWQEKLVDQGLTSLCHLLVLVYLSKDSFQVRCCIVNVHSVSMVVFQDGLMADAQLHVL